MKLDNSRPRWRRTRDRVLPVEAGQVMCPQRGTLDAEHCWMCPLYRASSGGSGEDIVCAIDTRLMPAGLRSMTA